MEETRGTPQFGRNINSLFRAKKTNSSLLFARKRIHEEKKCAVLFVSLESFIGNIKEPL
jgi:hypothetical protein